MCGLISCFQTIIDTSDSPVIRSKRGCPLLAFVVFVPRGGGPGWSWQGDWVLNYGWCPMVYTGTPSQSWPAPLELRFPSEQETPARSSPSGVRMVIAILGAVWPTCGSCLSFGQHTQQGFALIYKRRMDTWAPGCGCCIHRQVRSFHCQQGKTSPCHPRNGWHHSGTRHRRVSGSDTGQSMLR